MLRESMPGSRLQELNSKLAGECLRRGHGYAVHRPCRVFLQVMPACNLACTMCSLNVPAPGAGNQGITEALSLPVFEGLLRDVLPYSRETWLGVSGEPTLSKDFVPILEQTAAAGQEVHLITNGTRFHRPGIGEAIVDHVAALQISIDAASESTYEAIRIKGDWKGLMQSLERLDALRMAQAREARGRLSFSFVLMKDNVHELPAFIQLAHALHADDVLPQQLIPVSTDMAGQVVALDRDLLVKVIEPTVRAARELSIGLHLPPDLADLLRTGGSRPSHPKDEPAPAVAPWCRFAHDSVVIMGDGLVFPCCHGLAQPKMLMGDLRTQSFEEIWNGRVLRNLRSDLSRATPPDVCRSCSLAEGWRGPAEDPLVMAQCPDLTTHYGSIDMDPPTGPAHGPGRQGACSLERAGSGRGTASVTAWLARLWRTRTRD